MKIENIIDGTDYEWLIRSIDAEIITFSNFMKLDKIDKRYLCIRHDVDIDIDGAVQFARFEDSVGIRSTYFVLHTADYFNLSASKYLVLQNAGHDVGFHNDVLREHIYTGKSIKSLIYNSLKFLRDSGVKVDGTSAHGHRHCYEEGFLNYEIWKEFKNVNNEGFLSEAVRTFSLDEFGLTYETYFVDYEVYLSEAGVVPATYKWYGYMANEVDTRLFDKNIKFSKDNISKESISKFNEKNSGMFQLSIHPNRKKWRLSR